MRSRRYLPLVAALLTPPAHAQDYAWAVSDSGDADGIIEPGEEAIISLEVFRGPDAGVAFAWSHFDILGLIGWEEGEVLDVRIWHCGDTVLDIPPEVQDNNDILAILNFQLPGFFNCGCCGDPVNPTPQVTLTYRPTTYFDRDVAIDAVNFIDYQDVPGRMNFYTDELGEMNSLEPATEPLAFRVVCPADLVPDGDINSEDFLAFLNLFAAADPAADWNQDGAIDTRDAIAYLTDWVAGC